MSSLLLGALFVSTVVALAAVIAAVARAHRTYRGYEDVRWQVRRLEALLGGTAVREGRDVVVSGVYKKLGAVVRFSIADDTPELNIRLQALSGFTLFVTPLRTAERRGTHAIVTGDRKLDSCFLVRTDDPFYADTLLESEAVRHVRKLCSAPLTYVAVHQGSIELSELARPALPMANHVKNCLGHMVRLGAALERMPGLERAEAWTRRRRNLLFRAALACSVIAASIATLAVTRTPARPGHDAAGQKVALESGIPQAHATRISHLAERLAEVSDFHSAAVAWMRDAGGEPAATIAAEFSGGAGLDSVYVLKHRSTGETRIVVFLQAEKRYDATFETLALVARVPKANLAEVEWARRPPGQLAGDGLLIVRRYDEQTDSATVLFHADGRILSAVPRDYRALNLRP